MSLKAKRPSKREEVKEQLLKNVIDSEETSRLNADIEKSLYRRIKMRCIEEDKTISSLTRELWNAYLSK